MIYLSGPISNEDPEVQKHNLAVMNLRACELRDLGHEVFNPAELETDGKGWDWYLVRDLFWIKDNHPKFFFMRGWEKSRGCKLEHEAALTLGCEIEYEE
jgi:hypothetical protein